MKGCICQVIHDLIKFGSVYRFYLQSEIYCIQFQKQAKQAKQVRDADVSLYQSNITRQDFLRSMKKVLYSPHH